MNIEDLKAKAIAATPGPWIADQYFVGTTYGRHNIVSGASEKQMSENAAFIAAANPSAILELIAELETTKAERNAANNVEKSFELKVERDALHARIEIIELITELEEGENFKRGAKAVFDHVLSVACNRYHGDPKLNAAMQLENDLMIEVAEEALESASASSFREWKEIAALTAELEAVKAERDALRARIEAAEKQEPAVLPA